MAYEFKLREIDYERQKEIMLNYKGKSMGSHWIDFLIERQVIDKSNKWNTEDICPDVSGLTYMKVMKKKVGLLINFNIERLKDWSYLKIRMDKRSQREGIKVVYKSFLLRNLCGLPYGSYDCG